MAAQGYEVVGPNGERGWWDGKKITPLGANGLPDAKPAYAEAFAKGQAAKDLKKIEGATEGVQIADNLVGTAGQARKLLDEGIPTGGFAETRLELGRRVGGKVANALSFGFIPTKEETSKMERFRQLTNEAVLGDVGKLKGPLSDRDITFLKDTQASIGSTPGANRRALAAHEWAATRLSAYESALQRWTKDLGAPSALNPRGQSFDAWFSGWSNQNIPPPNGETFTYRSPNAPAKQTGGQAAPSAPAKKTGGQAKTATAPKVLNYNPSTGDFD